MSRQPLNPIHLIYDNIIPLETIYWAGEDAMVVVQHMMENLGIWAGIFPLVEVLRPGNYTLIQTASIIPEDLAPLSERNILALTYPCIDFLKIYYGPGHHGDNKTPSEKRLKLHELLFFCSREFIRRHEPVTPYRVSCIL